MSGENGSMLHTAAFTKNMNVIPMLLENGAI
jgi:hypothetical protein